MSYDVDFMTVKMWLLMSHDCADVLISARTVRNAMHLGNPQIVDDCTS